jgi:exopolysaccharide biosynthesis polyprenyl glycosylphosphotransferase
MTAHGALNTNNLHPSAEPAESVAQTGGLTLVPEVGNRSAKIWFSLALQRPVTILILIMMDTIALLVGLVFAGYLAGGESRAIEVIRFAPILLMVWLAVFVAWDLYTLARNRRKPGKLLGAILSGTGLLIFATILYPQSGFSLQEALLGTLFIVLLEGVFQLLYERGRGSISRRTPALYPTLIVGEDKERTRIRQAIERSLGAYTCVGELETNAGAIDLPLLRKILDRTGARSVILTGPERLSPAQFPELLRSMRLRKVKVKLVPGASTLMTDKPVAFLGDLDIPLLEVGSPRLDSSQWFLKRMLDVAGSLGGLIVLAPLLIGVAILIKLTSQGPVFFRQKRVGADERIFICYKFRSMYKDAERRQAELEARNEAGGVIFKIKNDPRITPVGRFIRRWSIDELPQLINVFKGEMSLVGPRPLPVRDVDLMGEVHKKRLATVPGITGFWQISGRSDLSFEEMLRLDLHYIESWSLSLDIKILLKTLMVVLRHDGAY